MVRKQDSRYFKACRSPGTWGLGCVGPAWRLSAAAGQQMVTEPRGRARHNPTSTHATVS
jgi:hypothetical protein